MSIALTVFKSFEGKWQLNRLISDQGSAIGTAVFKKIINNLPSLHYREEGVYKNSSGESNEFYKDYYFQLIDNQINVYFDKQLSSFFQKLYFTNKTYPVVVKCDHKCLNDLYKGIYTFQSPTEFTLSYSVIGPQKNYTMVTTYKKF